MSTAFTPPTLELAPRPGIGDVLPGVREVEFEKILGFWATTVLKHSPTTENHSQTALSALESAIKTEILNKVNDNAPRDGGWTLSDLFSMLNNWFLPSTTPSGDTYADWANLFNCGLWLVRNLEDEISTVDFRENTENILLQRDAGDLIGEHEDSTVLITQTTANSLHGSSRQERCWLPMAKKLASSHVNYQKARAVGWSRGVGLLRCEHQHAELTTQEYDNLALLDPPLVKLPERPQTPVEPKAEYSSGDEGLTNRQKFARRIRRGKLSEPAWVIDAARQEEEWRHHAEPYERAKRYLRDRLRSHVSVTHAYSMVLVGRDLRLIYADRQGLIITTPIHIIQDLSLFLSLLFVLQRFDQRQWGNLPGLSTNTLRLNTRTTYRLSTRLHHNHGIVGRQTIVHAMVDENGESCVAKFSWQFDDGRKMEHEWLNEAWQITPAGDKEHLLPSLGWKRYDITTRTIRESLGLPIGKPRLYYVLVLPVASSILRQIENDEWLVTFWECFKMYFALWKNGICQGDISDTNMVVQVVDNQREWAGALIDFDQALNVADLEARRDRQSGSSNIFRSRAAHFGRKRTFYDEVESFFWVGLYDSCLGTQSNQPKPTQSQKDYTRSILRWGILSEVVARGKNHEIENKGWEDHLPKLEHQDSWPWIKMLGNIVASEEAPKMEEQALYDWIMTEVCEPCLKFLDY